MAYTAVQAVNIVFKRVGVVAGDSQAITSFTDTAHQREIDVALQVWNDVLHQLFSYDAFDNEVDEGSITLVDDSGNTARTEYAPAADFEQFVYPAVLINAANNHRLYEYPGGYTKMYADQPDPTDFTGRPNYFVINSDSGSIRPDTHPQADQSGEVYKYLYQKRFTIAATTDTFPVSDTVVDFLVSPVSEVWRAIMNGDSREGPLTRAQVNAALKFMRQKPPRQGYGRRATH